MKITLSKKQWETIGAASGWLKTKKAQVGRGGRAIKVVESRFMDDRVDGHLFGRPGKYYDMNLTQTQKMKDDSDMNRETGYGEHWEPIGEPEVQNFEVIEFVDNGISGVDVGGRTTFEIKEQEPQLYGLLLEYAQTHVEEVSSSELERPYED